MKNQEEDKFQILRNKYTDIIKFSSFNIEEFLEYLKMKRERERDNEDSNFLITQQE